MFRASPHQCSDSGDEEDQPRGAGGADFSPSMLTVSSCENEEEMLARMENMKRETYAACLAEVETHLDTFLKQNSRGTYEEWIGELHPENVHSSKRNGKLAIDHRFYIEGSDHRRIWNAHVDGRRSVPARGLVPAAPACGRSGLRCSEHVGTPDLFCSVLSRDRAVTGGSGAMFGGLLTALPPVPRSSSVPWPMYRRGPRSCSPAAGRSPCWHAGHFRNAIIPSCPLDLGGPHSHVPPARTRSRPPPPFGRVLSVQAPTPDAQTRAPPVLVSHAAAPRHQECEEPCTFQSFNACLRPFPPWPEALRSAPRRQAVVLQQPPWPRPCQGCSLVVQQVPSVGLVFQPPPVPVQVVQQPCFLQARCPAPLCPAGVASLHGAPLVVSPADVLLSHVRW